MPGSGIYPPDYLLLSNPAARYYFQPFVHRLFPYFLRSRDKHSLADAIYAMRKPFPIFFRAERKDNVISARPKARNAIIGAWWFFKDLKNGSIRFPSACVRPKGRTRIKNDLRKYNSSGRPFFFFSEVNEGWPNSNHVKLGMTYYNVFWKDEGKGPNYSLKARRLRIF